jgi:diaminohydroxyphosphoribosylaminopyrimidine deaminase/5-amino-6-(5-phosphoribosylamino)uracil reductase
MEENYRVRCVRAYNPCLHALNLCLHIQGFFWRSGMRDEQYMRLALELAGQGRGWTRPNPLVGAVLVKDGEVIGTGYHERFGGPHAERAALEACPADMSGATLYVTLEPCCHHGKTPPCTDIIIEKHITRVVAGTLDPNPLVAGRGAELLRENGIAVESGVLEAECAALNKIFFHYITTKMPFVTVKFAATLDGKIAARRGERSMITGEAAQKRAHEARRDHAAILAGIGTVLADDPLLTCRIENAQNPLRVIVDSRLRIPLSSRLVRSAAEAPLLVATLAPDTPEKAAKKAALEALGVEVLVTDEDFGRVALDNLMAMLAARGIDSVLCEGGASVNSSILKKRLAQNLQIYIGAKFSGGGPESLCPFEGDFPPDINFSLKNPERLGNDALLEYDLGYHGEAGRCLPA